MEIIKLNLIPSGVNPTCHAKQYDKGRTIRFELFNGLTPYTLQSGDTVTLNLRKPDNTIIESSVTATQGNNYVDLVTTEQMCAVVGYNLGCFKIVNGEDDIGTLNFIMAVERDVLADGIPSQSVIEDLDALVQEAVGDNYYTKTEVDSALALKADSSDVEAALALKANTSDVNNALTDINEKLNGVYAEYSNQFWTVGGLYPSYGGEAVSTTRLRTDYISKLIKRVTPINNYKFMILAYQQDNTYIGVWNGNGYQLSANWITSTVDIKGSLSTYNLRLLLAKQDDTTITQSDGQNLKVYEFINTLLPKSIVTLDSLSDFIKYNFVQGKFEEQIIAFGADKKYINCNNGLISDAGSIDGHVSDYINCENIKYIRYTGSPAYAFACLAFYDETKTFIRAYPSSSSTTKYWFEEIEVPNNAKYVVFANNSAISGSIDVKIEYMVSYATLLNRKWLGKKWTCVGDSLTEINDRASMRYMDYIQIDTGIKPYNMGLSGTGYANKHAQGNAFVDRIVNVPIDSDVVTIFGSNNDVFVELPVGDITDRGTESLCGFINDTIDALYTSYPRAILGIITPCPWENIYPSAITTIGLKGIAYSEALVNICKLRGIPYLDLFHCSGLRPYESAYREIYYTNDDGAGVHPNELGHKILASHIKAFLETLII